MNADRIIKLVKTLLAAAVFAAGTLCATAQHKPVKRHHLAADSIEAQAPDSVRIVLGGIEGLPVDTAARSVLPDSVLFGGSAQGDSIVSAIADSIAPRPFSDYDVWEPRDIEFNPDPTRAVWMSALFPGLGQLYNRRYWKLPIVIGAYMGLGYATSWNNGMLTDYTTAYRDIMDNDPSTKSYMNFFPPNTKEEDLDKQWLTNVLQSRKNFYRRNRDLCIICMVGVYLVAMVDAYVDASLSHFDISPDLSMDLSPALFREERGIRPAVGLVWALNF